MKLRKADFAGTGKVFAFSVQQYFKSKATIALMAIMLIGSVGGVLLMNLGMSRGMNSGHDAERIYILQNTPYLPDLAAVSETLEVELVDGSVEDWLERLDGEPRSVLITALPSEDKSSWLVTGYTGEDSDVGSMEAGTLADACARALEAARFQVLGIASEQITEAMTPYSVEERSEAAFRREQSAGEEARVTGMMAGFGCSLLVYMLITISNSYIVKAVSEEKGSKLVELLMVSVRPLALITGKILGAVCMVAACLVLLSLGLLGTRVILSLLGMEMEAGGLNGIVGLLSGMSFWDALTAVVSILLGYLSFAVLGGIGGSRCGTQEEGDSAAGGVMLVAAACYVAGIASGGFGKGAASTVMSLLPLLSPFVAPAKYLTGQISFGILACSWLIQAAAILALARFCAAVYGALLIHRGERVKLRQLLALAKGGTRV